MATAATLMIPMFDKILSATAGDPYRYVREYVSVKNLTHNGIFRDDLKKILYCGIFVRGR